jgi:hypothetical protein
MPSPIMSTEAAFLAGPDFAAPRARGCRADVPFETLAEMAGVDVRQLDPAVLREATGICARCACRKACRRWLRTGVFKYAGDSRCPNAALLRR